MKVVAIILFVLQAIGLFGSISSGEISFMLAYGGLAYWIGYFLPAIIGVILLVIHNKRKNK